MSSAAMNAKASASAMKMRKSSKNPWGNPIVYFFALLLIAVCIVPVLYIILGGFRTNSQITNDPSGLPHPWVVENYLQVLQSSEFWGNGQFPHRGDRVMIGTVVLGLMVSFVIARYPFRFSGAMYALFAAGLMFPMTVAITPLYLLLRNLGLVNSLLGSDSAEIAFALPQTIIILVPFLQAIPKELEEASALDGCSRLGFFWRMVVPLSMPGVATTGILAFVNSWNNYMLPLFMINSEAKYTVPLGVQMFSSQYASIPLQVLAFTSMSMIPALLCFSIFQKQIVGGLTGAVKG